MLYLQIASPKSSVLNFLDSNSFEVIISIFQRTEKVPDMERLHKKMVGTPVDLPQEFFRINRDIWQALTIKVGASFLTFSKSS